jgi:hypothetical protein
MPEACAHHDQAREVTPSGTGCDECLSVGDRWVHLRLCMVCGKVGCCDNSKNRHARAHFHADGHALIQSYEPNEEWWWCYLDEVVFLVPGSRSFSYDDAG